MANINVESVLSQLTLEEKVGLTAGILISLCVSSWPPFPYSATHCGALKPLQISFSSGQSLQMLRLLASNRFTIVCTVGLLADPPGVKEGTFGIRPQYIVLVFQQYAHLTAQTAFELLASLMAHHLPACRAQPRLDRPSTWTYSALLGNF